MTIQPESQDDPAPTSADAARMLGEISPAARIGHRAALDASSAYPLLAWGMAWMVGTGLFELAPVPVGLVLYYAVCAVAMVAWCMSLRSRSARLLTERRSALFWVAFLAATPFLVAVAAPPNAELMIVFLCSLWGVGMLLFGIGVKDLPCAATGAGILVAAAVARVVAPGAALLIVGFGGGLAFTALGAWRLWRTL